MQNCPSLFALAFFHEGVNGSEASYWLALRASVLRRAFSSLGTAQERREAVNAGAVSKKFVEAQKNVAGRQYRAAGAMLHRTSGAAPVAAQPVPVRPAHSAFERQLLSATRQAYTQERHLRNSPPASPVAFIVGALPYTQQLSKCCLTGRSTGPIAAGRHLGYKSLAQMPTRRNRPVSYDVRHHRIQFQRGPRYGTKVKASKRLANPTSSNRSAQVERIDN